MCIILKNIIMREHYVMLIIFCIRICFLVLTLICTKICHIKYLYVQSCRIIIKIIWSNDIMRDQVVPTWLVSANLLKDVHHGKQKCRQRFPSWEETLHCLKVYHFHIICFQRSLLLASNRRTAGSKISVS